MFYFVLFFWGGDIFLSSLLLLELITSAELSKDHPMSPSIAYWEQESQLPLALGIWQRLKWKTVWEVRKLYNDKRGRSVLIEGCWPGEARGGLTRKRVSNTIGEGEHTWLSLVGPKSGDRGKKWSKLSVQSWPFGAQSLQRCNLGFRLELLLHCLYSMEQQEAKGPRGSNTGFRQGTLGHQFKESSTVLPPPGQWPVSRILSCLFFPWRTA